MTFSKFGRIMKALVASAALGLGMTACGGGTIAYMWVLGTYYNQISGFKIDNYTGNLTPTLKSPFSSGGTNPQMLVVKTGGRFLYVVNTGSGQVGVPGDPKFKAPTGSGISEFSIGSGGTLTFEQTFSSQGTTPIWLSFDSTGNYLYVLDRYAPDYNAATNPNGSLTAFQVASDTGRLTLVVNSTIKDPQGKFIPYFEVGANPLMTKVGSNNCLYTLSANSIYPYVISPSSGQLAPTTTGVYQVLGSSNLTSINTSLGSSKASYYYLTDGGSNSIISLQSAGASCGVSPVAGSASINPATNAFPVNSVTSTDGNYLYVINQKTTANPPIAASSISAYSINSTGQLTQLTDPGGSNPYSSGSGSVCAVEDPSNQYLFVSNNTDSTVVGKVLDHNHGYLTGLQHTSVFPTTQSATCLAVSGSI